MHQWIADLQLHRWSVARLQFCTLHQSSVQTPDYQSYNNFDCTFQIAYLHQIAHCKK